MKHNYEGIDMEIVLFNATDVIRASGNPGSNNGSEDLVGDIFGDGDSLFP